MDDETDCKMDFKTLPGVQYYNQIPEEEIKDEEKIIRLEKFGSKVLIWQAICECGERSALFFQRSL